MSVHDLVAANELLTCTDANMTEHGELRLHIQILLPFVLKQFHLAV